MNRLRALYSSLREMKSGAIFILLLSFILFAGTMLAMAIEINKDTTFGLTSEEENYIKTIRNDRLVIGVTDRSAYAVDDNGLEYGTVMPVVNFMEYELDMEVDIEYGNWASIYAKLLAGEIDFMYGLPFDENVANEVMLAAPISEKALLLIVNRENYKAQTRNLDGIDIGLVSDTPQSYYINPYLHSASSVNYYDGDDDMIEAIKRNEIDAAIITGDSEDVIFNYNGLRLISIMPELRYQYTIGTCKEKYSQLIDIFNRFLLRTEEGDAFYEEMLAQRLWYDIEYFTAKEKYSIERIKEAYGQINCYIPCLEDIPLAYYKDEDLIGIYPDMLNFFEEITGIEFVIKTDYNSTEALSALSNNKLQIYAGLVKNVENKSEYVFSDDIYENNLVLAIKAGDEEVDEEDIGKYYWGTTETILPLLSTSVFNNHIIGYNTTNELYEALKNGEIKGMLVKQSMLDYSNLLSDEKYQVITDIKISAQEHLAYCRENSKLNELLDKLVFTYQVTHVGYENQFGNALVDYQQGMIENYLSRVNIQKYLVIASGIAIVLLLAITFTTIISTRKMKRLNAKMRTMCNSNSSMDILEINLGSEVIASSNGFKMFGLTQSESKDKFKVSELSELTGFDFKAHYMKIIEQDKDDFECEFSLRNHGRKYFLKEIGSLTGNYLVSTVIDISDKVEETQALRAKVEYDGLTGLYNRNAYKEKIREIIEQNPDKLGIFAFIDINKFKHINDTYGHAVGDEILVSFATSIRTLQKDNNTVVFRIAGDEFGAFRGNLENEADLMVFLSELQGLSMGTTVEGEFITTNYSCGVAVYGQDANDVDELSELADQAMYVCKEEKMALVTYQSSKVIMKTK